MSPLNDPRTRRSFPIITILLVVANVLVFAGWQLRTGVDQSVAEAGFLPREFTSSPINIWTWSYIFTSMFIHTGWVRLLGNMGFLCFYGRTVEDECGSTRFLFLYFLCGVAGTLIFTLIHPHGDIPLVGAGGAVSGVIGAYCLDFGAERRTEWEGRREVETSEFKIVLSCWFGMQVLMLNLEMPDQNRSIGSIGMALAALVGGFLAGAVLVVFFKKWRYE